MANMLLTVSGTIPDEIGEEIEAGKRPLADYIAMAQTLNADLVDYKVARQETGWVGQLIEKMLGSKNMLAWACFKMRRRYATIFTDGEQIGIPLAFLLKFANFGARPRHVTIGHILSVGKKMLFFDWLGIQSHIDIFFVYSTWQKRFIETRWHVSPDRVRFTPFMVDADFFSPERAGAAQKKLAEDFKTQRPLICAVGLEFRDYPTLLTAVEDLDVHVVIAAASPWSKREDSTAGQTIPPNVTVQKFTQFELRDLYAMSEFLVMPLYDVEFQAGITAILEGMAMEKAVVCSQTTGQTDVIVDGEHGIYVPPQDVEALRKAISYLLENREVAQKMGKNGRFRITQQMSLTCYVERLSAWLA